MFMYVLLPFLPLFCILGFYSRREPATGNDYAWPSFDVLVFAVAFLGGGFVFALLGAYTLFILSCAWTLGLVAGGFPYSPR